MKITREPLGENLERFEVSIARADWYDEYDKQLRTARREMSVPGFRKGQAPLGLVAKRLGGEEFMFRFVNEAQSRGLGKYIEEEGITVAYPFVPSEEGVPMPDFHAEQTVTLRYDVIVAPRYEFPKSIGWMPVEVEATEAQWAEQEKEILTANKVFQDVEEVGEETFMRLMLAKAPAPSPKESGEEEAYDFSLSFEKIPEEDRSLFAGRRVGDEVEVQAGSATYNIIVDSSRYAPQGQREEVLNLNREESLHVKLVKIEKRVPAELTWEFYERYFALPFLAQVRREAAEEKTDDAAELRERFRNRYIELVRENAAVSNGLEAFERALADWSWSAPEEHVVKMLKLEERPSASPEFEMEYIRRRTFADQLMQQIGEEALQSEEYTQIGERCLDLFCLDTLNRTSISAMYGIMPGAAPVSRYLLQSFLPQQMDNERFQARLRARFTYAAAGHYLLNRIGAATRTLGVDQLTFNGEVVSEVEEKRRKEEEQWASWQKEFRPETKEKTSADEQSKEEGAEK